MLKQTAHPEWVLSHIVEIDRFLPGFCGSFFRTSNERRQVIAAFLAAQRFIDGDVAGLGQFLRSADHRSILTAAFGSVPNGLRGALRRAGVLVHHQRVYTLLHQLLAEPPHAGIPSCIARLATIDLTKLLVLRLLPPEIAVAPILNLLDDARTGNDVGTAFHLLADLGVDRDALAAAICRVRSKDELARLWKRWMMKVPAIPPHPVPATPTYFPVASLTELVALSRMYRNCAATRYPLRVLEGTDSFAEVHHGSSCAVAHLRHKEGRWRFEGGYGRRNAPPSTALLHSLHKHLVAHGVRVPERERRKPTDWDSLRRLTSASFFDFDLD